MTRRPASFTEADIRRVCKAAPDRAVEVRLPDGTVIRLEPGVDKPKVTQKREVRL